jgi:1,4-alpha-glucan branching enzyme
MEKTKKEKPAKDKIGSEEPVEKELSQVEATTKTVGTQKVYLRGKHVCKATFKLPKVAAPDAKCVCVVGDFNNWSIHANPMKKLKNGDYTITLDLEPGREYQFRYLIDESRWENDWNADKYVKSCYGDNSVVVT